jgi:hypothetical protein
MTDLGIIKRYLGISFDTVPLGTFLHQRDYKLSILTDFGMEHCKSAPSPLPEGLVLVTNMASPYVDSTHYYKLVGKLIFLTITRPDLAYAVSCVSSYMANPQQTHLDAAKHILRYLRGNLDHDILYRAGSPLEAIGFTDADWGSCPETRRSMGAYIFTFTGGPITWQSKPQLTVSRSSTKSEYRALNDDAQEAVWLHQLLLKLQVMPSPSSSTFFHASHPQPNIKLFCDNQGALKLSHNPVFHARSKHIEIHYHFIRERVLEGEIQLHYIHTNEQPADALTKPLGRIKFHKHRTALGMYSLTSLKSQKAFSPPCLFNPNLLPNP